MLNAALILFLEDSYCFIQPCLLLLLHHQLLYTSIIYLNGWAGFSVTKKRNLYSLMLRSYVFLMRIGWY